MKAVLRAKGKGWRVARTLPAERARESVTRTGRIGATVEPLLADLRRATGEGGAASVAELFAGRLEREPAVAGYIRPLLGHGSPAGLVLFARYVDRAGRPFDGRASGPSRRRGRGCSRSILVSLVAGLGLGGP